MTSWEQTVFPMLSYEDAGAAAEWTARAFGFEELERYASDDGTVTHVTMRAGSGLLMFGWPGPEYRSPRHHAETCDEARRWLQVPYVVDGVLVYVDGIDEHHARSTAEGARILSEVEENRAIGQKQYRAEDIEGHRWMFAERLDADTR